MVFLRTEGSESLSYPLVPLRVEPFSKAQKEKAGKHQITPNTAVDLKMLLEVSIV